MSSCMNSARKRIVFDTSALIPICLHPEREPAQIFRQAILYHDVFASQEALVELLTVLSRPKFDAWRPLGQRLAWATLYQSAVKVVEVIERVQDCRDAKDNKFLELALTAKADILVSSDIHLLELNPYRTIGIVGLQELKRWV
ncbi:MAG: putative toxin-antitoxin system toxin component, PIN family [Comamonadaceae bacterium]|jgi:putative PIN family toxin of toxin-antitoxin system|nr:MAG: putative toxin-antitoxin system toxin component, PIN family [Comamonadaceae bacterium]